MKDSLSKSAQIFLWKWIFYVKNHSNNSDFFWNPAKLWFWVKGFRLVPNSPTLEGFDIGALCLATMATLHLRSLHKTNSYSSIVKSTLFVNIIFLIRTFKFWNTYCPIFDDVSFIVFTKYNDFLDFLSILNVCQKSCVPAIKEILRPN